MVTSQIDVRELPSGDSYLVVHEGENFSAQRTIEYFFESLDGAKAWTEEVFGLTQTPEWELDRSDGHSWLGLDQEIEEDARAMQVMRLTDTRIADRHGRLCECCHAELVHKK